MSDLKNNIKSLKFCQSMNENLYNELKRLADKKYMTVQAYINSLATNHVIDQALNKDHNGK